MKKTALVMTLLWAIFVSLVAEIHVVKVAVANPINPWKRVIPVGTVPAKVSILSPRNNTAYPSGDLNITVQIAKPETPSLTAFDSHSVNLFLDGVLIDSISEYIPRSKTDINTIMHNPFIGKHKLVVKASYFLGGFSIDSSSTIFFTVENASSLPNPSPSPEPTSTPIATPEPAIETESFPSSLVMASSVTVAAVCVGLGLLVYLIKRK